MKTKKTKEAISLIVLVLTIVIMIILAGVIIANLNDTAIITRGKQAVKNTNIKQMQEIATAAWGEAIIEDVDATPEELKEKIVEKLKTGGMTDIELAKYRFNVTTSGVKVEVYDGWTKVGFSLVKGNQVIEIGDKVNYKATDSDYNGQWRVLNADEDGNLLILSDDVFPDFGVSDTDQHVAWLNMIDELNEYSKKYGTDDHAIKARSIRVEDIDNITGYDKTTYGTGEVEQYGNEIKFTYSGIDSDGCPVVTYTSLTGSGEIRVDSSYNGLHFYDGKEFKKYDDLETINTGDVIATIKTDFYTYDAKKFGLTEKVSEMLFETNSYWLATRYTTSYGFGMYIMNDGILGTSNFVGIPYTYEPSFDPISGLRVVVTLPKDIVFTGSSSAGWSY